MLKRLTTPNERPLMVVYAGPNGAGKSKLTKLLEPQLPSLKVIDADAIAKTFTDRPKAQADIAAGRETVRQVRSSIEQKKSFSIETTLGGKSVLGQMKQAKAAGFHVHLYYVGLNSPELHIARVAQRVAQGGHDISPEDIRRRFVTSKQNLPEAMLLADRTLIFDNTKEYQQAVEVNRGKLKQKLPENEMPVWVKDVVKEWKSGIRAAQNKLNNERDLEL